MKNFWWNMQPSPSNAAATLELSAEHLETLFPFHVAFNEALDVVQVGPVLQRLYPSLTDACRVDQVFRLAKPRISFAFDAIRQQSDAIYMLEALHTPLKLRGQMLHLQDSNLLLFLGSPWVTGTETLRELNLNISDFARHDAIVDYLFLLQAQQTALTEAKRMSAQVMQQRAELRASEERYRSVVDQVGEVIVQLDVEGRCSFLNRAWVSITGHAVETSIGTQLLDYVHPDDRLVVRQRFERLMADLMSDRFEVRLIGVDQQVRVVEMFLQPRRDAAGQVVGLAGTLNDVTERQRTEEERLRLQDELIRAQALTLEELSTPLIAISDDVMVMPLVGSVDSDRATRMVAAVLDGIARSSARTVILDITGVRVVDTVVAHTLIQTGKAVRLVGGRLIVTGIRPEVAHTIVGLGVSMGDLITFSSLQQGIAAAAQIGVRSHMSQTPQPAYQIRQHRITCS